MKTVNRAEVETILLEAKNRLSLPMKALDVFSAGNRTYTPEERTCIYDAVDSIVSDLEALCYTEEERAKLNEVPWRVG